MRPDRIGILLERKVLLRAAHRLWTYERLDFYKEMATGPNGYDLILFCMSQMNLRRHTVRGYVPSETGWRPVIAPIPRVIHKRVLYRSPLERGILQELQARGVIFVNPPFMNDKATMHSVLSRSTSLQKSIPPTQMFRWTDLARRLDDGGSAIIKPRIGSVGFGVIRVVPLGDDRIEVTDRSRKTFTRAGLRDYLRSRVRPGRYLLQHYVDLARFQGRPFDLRVPVQQDGDGAWHTPGMVAKVAGRHPFLTNLAQGGRALPGTAVLEKAFPSRMLPEIVDRVSRLALSVAEVVNGHFRHAVDLGLDIGLDTDGKPWLIEVNCRDQRITFQQAGMQDAFRTLYHYPIAYCARLLQNERKGDRRRGEPSIRELAGA